MTTGKSQRSLIPDTGWKLRYAPHMGLVSTDEPLFLHRAGSADPVEQIAHAASLGFAGVEDNFLKMRSPLVQERIGAELAREGLALGCFVNNPMHWNKPLWGSNALDARAQLERDLDDSIAAAGRTGARWATVVGAREPSIPIAYQLANMVENLKRLAEPAEKAGLILAIETVNDRRWPGQLLPHIADAYAVAKAVGSSAVRLVFDIGHVAPMDGEVIANLEACWEMIAIIQVADTPGRLELGTGELNWVNIFRFIRAGGYTGLIELEHTLSEPGLAGEEAMLAKLKAIDSAI
jgi:hydroxypyruvate isomerase